MLKRVSKSYASFLFANILFILILHKKNKKKIKQSYLLLNSYYKIENTLPSREADPLSEISEDDVSLS